MASSSGNSSGSIQLQNSGSDEDLQLLVDQRKRKRMQSNRESARRSRMRKQKHLDDLIAQVGQLTKDNNEILTSINITTQHYVTIESENNILRAQLMEVSQRLESLNEIIKFISTSSSNNASFFEPDLHHHQGLNTAVSDSSFANSMNSIYLNQPIMAASDMFQYY